MTSCDRLHISRAAAPILQRRTGSKWSRRRITTEPPGWQDEHSGVSIDRERHSAADDLLGLSRNSLSLMGNTPRGGDFSRPRVPAARRA